MKSSINEIPDTYPFLGKYKTDIPDSSFVVFFIEPRKGIVVHTEGNNPAWKIGFHSSTWVMSCFEEFTGTVTLSNK